MNDYLQIKTLVARMTSIVPNHKRTMSTVPFEKENIAGGDVLVLLPSSNVTTVKKIKKEEDSHETQSNFTSVKKIKKEEDSHEENVASTTTTIPDTAINNFKTKKEEDENDIVPETMLTRASASGTSSNSNRSTNSSRSDSSYIMTRREFNVYMTDWLRDNFIYPYPDNDIIDEMMARSGRNRVTVNNWLSNNRSRKWYHVMEAVLAMKRPSDYYYEDCINYFDGKPLRVLPPRRTNSTTAEIKNNSSEDDDDNAQTQEVASVPETKPEHQVVPSLSPSYASSDEDVSSNSCSTLTSSITSETCYATSRTPATSIASDENNNNDDQHNDEIVSNNDIDWDSLQLPHLNSNNWIDLLDDTFYDEFSFHFNNDSDDELLTDTKKTVENGISSVTTDRHTNEGSGNEDINFDTSDSVVHEVGNQVDESIPSNDTNNEIELVPSNDTNNEIDLVPSNNTNKDVDLVPSNDTNIEIDVVKTNVEIQEIENISNQMKRSNPISTRTPHRYNTRRNKQWKATIERCRYITRQNKLRKIKVEYDE